MLTTYYTYRLLSGEWNILLPDKVIAGAYSSSKNEVVIDFSDETAIVFGYHGRLRYLFRSDRSSKPRRNVVSVLPSLEGMRILGVEIAEGDRIVTIRGDKTVDLIFLLFGSRPNVMAVRDGKVVDAFKSSQRLVQNSAPVPQPARQAATVEEMLTIVGQRPLSNEKAVAAAFPLMDRMLATEVVHRAALEPEGRFKLAQAASLFRSALEVVDLLVDRPEPRIYWRDGTAETFSLIELSQMAALEEEAFDTVDSAVGVFCRKRLAQNRLSERRDPILRAVDDALRRAERRSREVAARLSQPSRADTYERWGHLLMASGLGEASGMSSVVLDDLFEGTGPIEIPLKDSLTVIENAGEYYGRARRTRLSRSAAKDRLRNAEQEAEELRVLHEEIADVSSVHELESYLKRHANPLERVAGLPGSARRRTEPSRFRRFVLKDSYTIYVGRNARENDELTFGFAQKFDIWLHARGVPGSHTVLRLPNRDSVPDRRLIETAASVAAYFSKARGSGLVPVVYTPRKFVRRAKGAASGKVIVEREEVVIVPPALPSVDEERP